MWKQLLWRSEITLYEDRDWLLVFISWNSTATTNDSLLSNCTHYSDLLCTVCVTIKKQTSHHLFLSHCSVILGSFIHQTHQILFLGILIVVYKSLCTFYQYITWNTRWNKILDLCYGSIKGGNEFYYWSSFGFSDYI